jgi:hypothetical protein
VNDRSGHELTPAVAITGSAAPIWTPTRTEEGRIRPVPMRRWVVAASDSCGFTTTDQPNAVWHQLRCRRDPAAA